MDSRQNLLIILINYTRKWFLLEKWHLESDASERAPQPRRDRVFHREKHARLQNSDRRITTAEIATRVILKSIQFVQ